MEILERFLKYVSFDTQSSEESTTTPSTARQLNLAKYLKEELESIGVDKVIYQEDTGIVYGFINANDNNKDSIGLIAHMDTSPDASGENIKPRIVDNYDGKEIVLNKDLNMVLSPSEFPHLLECIGHQLVVTDGTTLLGADDKAGIAIIMNTIEHILNNKEIKHGNISVAFTPDEEVGRGTENFDINLFNCDYAFTVDGGDVHTIEFETFNAAAAKVIIHGKSIHPGSAKGKMINASNVAMEFDSLLPSNELPELTEGYEGFHHITGLKAECEEGTIDYIIRNHDSKILERQKQDFINAKETINKKYGKEVIELIIRDQYCNMRQYIEKNPKGLNKAIKAYETLNEPHKFEAVRGGTDGAELSKRGLPTPNLGTGGANYHGKYEYVSTTDMSFMVKVLLEILK